MKDMTLIIMAAGDSLRFCEDKGMKAKARTQILAKSAAQKPLTKKQWLRLGTTPLWIHVAHTLCAQILESLHTIAQTNPKSSHTLLQKIIVTASPKDVRYMRTLIAPTLSFVIKDMNLEIPIQIVEGGSTRYQSLQCALTHVNTQYVIVNDCARFDTKFSVLHDMIENFIADEFDCIVPYLRVTDTTLCSSGNSYTPIPRDQLKLIQTPQISNTQRLRQSYDKGQDFSDESSAICALNTPLICFVLGSKEMAKLTYRDDIALLKKLHYSHKGAQNTLIGHGCDIHAFEDSKPMYLCGVQIDSAFGFKAHSDGDVGIHAVIDSILGAMNYGDIGELFPDNDNTYKGIDSKILLKEVYDYCLSTGLEIVNLDITIIAQTPKISPYKASMQQCLAHILYLDTAQVSIKATTAERLGFIGRKEGVLVQSMVQLRARDLLE